MEAAPAHHDYGTIIAVAIFVCLLVGYMVSDIVARRARRRREEATRLAGRHKPTGSVTWPQPVPEDFEEPDEVVEVDDPEPEDESTDQEDARLALRELGLAIVAAQRAADSRPHIALINWHLAQAREWFSSANESYSNDEKYDTAMWKADNGIFHARLACEAAAEYQMQVLRLRGIGTAAPQADVAPAHAEEPQPDVLPVHEVPSDNAAHSDAPAANVPPVVQPLAADVVVAVSTRQGAEDVVNPDYCQTGDAAVEKGMREMRRLSLTMARTRSVIDALVAISHPDFIEATPFLDSAMEYLESAEASDTWEAAYDIAWDGVEFAKLALQLTREYLDAKAIALDLPDAAWDEREPSDGSSNGNSDDATYNDVLKALTEAASAALKARLAVTAQGRKPAIANYHLELAQSHLSTCSSKYRDEEWSDALIQAQQADFQANAALETAAVYEAEVALLTSGQPSTVHDEPADADPDYTGYTDEDIETAFVEWRKFSLKLAKLQALIDTRCTGFADGAAHLKSAQAFSEKAEAATDWEDIPDIIDDGMFFVDSGIEAAEAFLGQTHG